MIVLVVEAEAVAQALWAVMAQAALVQMGALACWFQLMAIVTIMQVEVGVLVALITMLAMEA